MSNDLEKTKKKAAHLYLNLLCLLRLLSPFLWGSDVYAHDVEILSFMIFCERWLELQRVAGLNFKTLTLHSRTPLSASLL